jgi:hypothetical protein
MHRTRRIKRTSLAVCLAVGTIAGVGSVAAPAMAAAGADNVVSGTTLGLLSLTSVTPAVFTTNFTPGGTAATTTNGTLLATNTAASSTLTVGDGGADPAGHMRATGGTCTGSDASLTNALSTTLTAAAGITSSGSVPIPAIASPATVATAAIPIAAKTLTAAYGQVIPAAQVMLTGCVYTLTATYTLQ